MKTNLVGLELLQVLEKPKIVNEENLIKKIRFVLIEEYLKDTRNLINTRELNKGNIHTH